MGHQVIIPQPTRGKLEQYLHELQAGLPPGARLAECLERRKPNSSESLVNGLLATKKPKIFAESAVFGDGSDWNQPELGLLGDISIAMAVTIFDNGAHRNPVIYETPFQGMLVFTPGALLRNGKNQTPADWNECVHPDGKFNREGYQALYERRLLPVFQHVNEAAAAKNQTAVISIPGLGCGQFAGPFKGKLGTELHAALARILTLHGQELPAIRAIYYDPFSEGTNHRTEIHGISLMMRPLMHGNEKKSQLCKPAQFADAEDDFSQCLLASIVAWDHVSWPGNDFFHGHRSTDDGVKAAATNSMEVLTGIPGKYDTNTHSYQPPPEYRNWADVVEKHQVRLA